MDSENATFKEYNSSASFILETAVVKGINVCYVGFVGFPPRLLVFGSAIDIHEKSAPSSIPTEMNSSSRLKKITLFEHEAIALSDRNPSKSGGYTT